MTHFSESDRRSGYPRATAAIVGAGSSANEVAQRKREQACRLQREAEMWEKGAAGEQATGLELRRLPPDFVSLHDLSIPGSKANADHLVIGPPGVFLIDTKVSNGRVRTSDGTLWRGRYPMRREFATIRFEVSRLVEHVGVPVTPIVCFAEGDLDRPDQIVDGVRVVQLDHLVAVLVGLPQGVLGVAEVMGVVGVARTLSRSAAPPVSRAPLVWPSSQARSVSAEHAVGKPDALNRRRVARAICIAVVALLAVPRGVVGIRG